MLKNRRRAMLGLLTAAFTSAVVAAITMPANALPLNDHYVATSCTDVPNLVVNCGFEAPASTDGVVPGWSHVVSHDAFVWNNQAHNGTHALAFGSGGADDVLTQTIKVQPHTQYQIGAWVYGEGTNNDLGLAATNIEGQTLGLPTDIYSGTSLASTWTHVGQTVTTSSGTTMTLVLRGANPPAHNYVDDISVIAVSAPCGPVANNRVSNCSFENAPPSTTPWVETSANHDSQLTTSTAWGGDYSLRLASTTVDDVWTQHLSVRPHTTYLLSYWVEYYSSSLTPKNDLHVSVSNVPAASGGKLTISTSNISNRFWGRVTRTFTTGASSSATLTIAGANKPASTFVDDVSITAVPHVKITHSGRVVTVTLNGVGGQKVYLQKLVSGHWKIVHTWTAPTSGYTKSWALTVGSAGTYRALAAAAPGYGSTASGAIAIK